MTRLWILVALALAGCSSGVTRYPNRYFTIVALVKETGTDEYHTIEGMMHCQKLEILKVKKGKVDQRELCFDLRTGQESPLVAGRTYEMKGAHGRHGIFFTGWKEVEERKPNKPLQTTRGDARRNSRSPLQSRALHARV